MKWSGCVKHETHTHCTGACPTSPPNTPYLTLESVIALELIGHFETVVTESKNSVAAVAAITVCVLVFTAVTARLVMIYREQFTLTYASTGLSSGDKMCLSYLSCG